MDDVNALIKEKYAKDAAYQEEMDQARKASSVLEDPLIKKIREQVRLRLICPDKNGRIFRRSKINHQRWKF